MLNSDAQLASLPTSAAAAISRERAADLGASDSIACKNNKVIYDRLYELMFRTSCHAAAFVRSTAQNDPDKLALYRNRYFRLCRLAQIAKSTNKFRLISAE